MGLSLKGFSRLFLCLLIFSSASSAPYFYPRPPCHRRTQCDDPKPFSFYWEIKRPSPSPPAYLFGTIHVPYTKVWDSIPQIAKDAFNSSDRIIFELDLLNSETMFRLSQCQMLPSGNELANVIPREIYLRLEQHLRYVKSQIPKWLAKRYPGLINAPTEPDQLFELITDRWERKGPIWIMMMLNSLTEQSVLMRDIHVLDVYLAHLARSKNKETGSVEKPKDQCNPLNSLDMRYAMFALNQTLLQHESTLDTESANTDELIKNYNCGNLDEVVFNQNTEQFPFLKTSHQATDEELEISRQIDDYFRSHLIVNRNRGMSRKILRFLSKNPNKSLFFAFGAGHFIGNDSIIQLLQNSGLEVVQVTESRRPHHECNSQYSVIRPPIGAYLRPTKESANTRKGLTRHSLVTISPYQSTVNGWIQDSIRRTLLSKRQPLSGRHLFPISESPAMPLQQSIPFPVRSSSEDGGLYQQQQTVSNTTTRQYLSIKDLLVREYISKYNRQYAANAQWPRVYHQPVYRTDAHLSSSRRQSGAQQHYWTSGGTRRFSKAPSCSIIACLIGLQLLTQVTPLFASFSNT